MAALVMAVFKIAITPFLSSFWSGLGSHAAEWAWSAVTGAGHHDIATNMKAGTATPDEQKTAQQVVASTVKDPAKASELQRVAATNPVAQPLAQNYSQLLSVQPQVWDEFSSGSFTLRALSESRAELFGWSENQRQYDMTSHCPIGGESLSPFGAVTYIDSAGKTLLSGWMMRQPPIWNPADHQFHDYAITAHCINGHSWQVYA
jgi:hypothetical protein